MNKVKGFTLIELMITVAIVGILSSFAYSSYRDNILRSEAVSGVAALSSFRVKLEQFFQDNRTYAGGCAIASSFNNQKFIMSCSIDEPADKESIQEYTITATSDNFEYTLDEANNKVTKKVPDGWSGKDSTCWVISKGGYCQ